jgi:hypothetical protein
MAINAKTASPTLAVLATKEERKMKKKKKHDNSYIAIIIQ